MYNEFSKRRVGTSKKSYIVGGTIGMIVSVLCMFVFAAILLLFNIDRAYSVPFATISVAVGCFVGSYITAQKINDKGYLVGIIIGSTIFIFITILSLTLGNGLSINTLFHFIIIILSSLVGGIMGVNRNKHKKYI